jgi:hypothetical protein
VSGYFRLTDLTSHRITSAFGQPIDELVEKEPHLGARLVAMGLGVTISILGAPCGGALADIGHPSMINSTGRAILRFAGK